MFRLRFCLVLHNFAIAICHCGAFVVNARTIGNLRDGLPFRNIELYSEQTDQQEEDTEWMNAELVDEDEFYDAEEEAEWIPDRDKAKMRREYAQRQSAATTPQPEKEKEKKRTIYTHEEEELISAMGGKFKEHSRRQPGYLGDSTLQEIAQDYSVPICYLADVLCMWGVPPPIDTKEILGDLVTGEQAFAILEAINSVDVAALHDRYSDMHLMDICDWYDIELKDGFEMAVKEGWSLPFGVKTFLRVEQEDELVRVLGSVV